MPSAPNLRPDFNVTRASHVRLGVSDLEQSRHFYTKVLGLVVSPWVVLAVPAALLVGFAFGAVGMAATSFMKTWQDFDLIQLVILPLFLFSATFYPLDTYPPALQWVVRVTPLYQGVDLIRSLTVGAISPVLLVHVAYLAIMGIVGLIIVSRRLDQLLLK